MALAFVWEKVKHFNFVETIAAFDLKVGRCIELNEMKLHMCQRSRSFFDLVKGPLVFNVNTCLPEKLLGHSKPNTMLKVKGAQK